LITLLKSGDFSEQRWWEAEFWFHDSRFASFRTEISFFPSNPYTISYYPRNKMCLSVTGGCQVVEFLRNEANSEERAGMTGNRV